MGLKQKRRSSDSVLKRNEEIIRLIKVLKAEHPFWGYRRIRANLRARYKCEVNLKRIYRLMKEENLLVPPNLRLVAKRTVNTSKPRPTKPNEWWGIDMTKVMVESFGWVYVVFVLDWHTKKIVGHYAGIQSKTEHWLKALDKGLNTQFSNGAREHNLHLMSDNGCQPTSTSFIETCANCGIKQAFTSYNNPKGNADTERLMRTFKEEFVWLREWASVTKFIDGLEGWVKYYNNEYLHSTLKYKSPVQFEKQRLGEILLAAA